jgi:hypothetical protein
MRYLSTVDFVERDVGFRDLLDLVETYAAIA